MPLCWLCLTVDRWLESTRENSSLWRRAVAIYYDIEDSDAKVVLVKALYDATRAPEGKSSLGVLPFLEGLASECAAAKETFALQRPHFVNTSSEERRDTKITTLAYVLMDKEHEVLNSLVTALPEAGLQLVAPLVDGVIICPTGLSDLWGNGRAGSRTCLMS